MKPGFLSVLAILLTVMKCHGLLPECELWMTLAPAVVDFVIAFLHREKLKRDVNSLFKFIADGTEDDQC